MKLRCKLLLVCASLCVATAGFAIYRHFFHACGFGSFSLSEATIEVASDNPCTRLAAEELGKHLELICGVRPRRVPSNGRFVLGRGPKGVPAPGDCESFARLENGVVYFWGDDRARTVPVQGWGTLFGVYGFLEKALGVRWVSPGDDGIVLKRRTSVRLPSGWSYAHRPSLDKTEIRLCARGWDRQYDGAKVPFALRLSPEALAKEDAERRLWTLRQRLQIRDPYDFGHAFGNWQKRFEKTHPEYIALNPDGTRGQPAGREVYAQQCFSNPAVQEQMLADWKSCGKPKRLNLCVNDSAYLCRCANCRAWDADLPGEEFLLHKTDRMLRFYNVMCEKAIRMRPDVEVCAYAYLDYRFAPRREKVAYPDHLVVGFVPSIYDDFVAVVDGWKAAGLRRFVIRPNYLCYNGFVPRGYERQFHAEHLEYIRRGMAGTDEDSFNRGTILDFETYVFARALADPRLSFETIEDEFLSQYGAAEPEMREYYGRVRLRGERERTERTRTRVIDKTAATRDDGEFFDNAVAGHSVGDLEGDLSVLDRALGKAGLSAMEMRRIRTVRRHVELAVLARKLWEVYVEWQKNVGSEPLQQGVRRAAKEMMAFACAHPDELCDNWARILPRPSYVGHALRRLGVLDELLD